MAVIGSALHWNGAVGNWQATGRRSYAAVYIVKTNNPLDGPTVINTYVAANLRALGATYSYGSDTDAEAIATMIDPKRSAQNAKLWYVTVSYETPDERTPTGALSLNPSEWRHELSTANRGVSEAATRLKYLQTVCLRAEDSYGPAMNQAGQIFDPPPERERWNEILRIEKYDTYFPNDAEDYIGRINNAQVFVSYPYWNYTRTWAKYATKCIAFSGVTMRINAFDVWRWTVEFETDKKTWKLKLPNIGTFARAQAGDKDQNGEFYTTGGSNPNTPPDSGVRELKDATGQPLRNPVPLDEEGQPLPAGADVEYLEFLRDDEADFDKLRTSYGLFGEDPEENPEEAP